MARFFGKVGFVTQGQLVNGIWNEGIEEREYYGTILNETQSFVEAEQALRDIRLSQRISIVSDKFALENYRYVKYVETAGTLWEVTSVTVERPRLILSLGGVYDGRTAADSA